jgi:hypothetical protein
VAWFSKPSTNPNTPDTLATLGEVGATRVDVGIGNSPRKQVVSAMIKNDANYLFFKLSEIESADRATPVVVEVRATNNDVYQLSLKRKKPFVAYGVAGTEAGVWIPIGLFSTKFQSSESGLALATMPISLAFGGKAYVADRFYFGGSLMVRTRMVSQRA